ncbi:puromycin sensitive aminopeptidase [Trichuris trichiura]|uniref:Aminopeptidase n=1 Tax=Trichuris trichiura TaxID=36087 RepID=A0A077Z146_TRITR|nr:puromycin sensitive aminopeptidase [Trichuris trichiura]
MFFLVAGSYSAQASSACSKHPFSFANPTMVCKAADSFERLPKIAIPQHYTLKLQPFFENFTFAGVEKIDLEILKPTNVLKFHAAEIDIVKAGITSGNDRKFYTLYCAFCFAYFGILRFDNLPVEYNSHWMTAELKLPKDINPGPAQLSLKFTGVLNDKLRGFYRSSYEDKDGVKHYMATTQFESTSARRAFPCWDEPAYKASFDITLVVPKEKTALSNMIDVSTTESSDGWKTVTYARTPIMSTYLVAFIVGDLDFVEDHTDSGVRLRVYTVPGKVSQGQFALEFAKKALAFYDEYFGIKYNLPKSMENWGLITYREMRLLFDPSTTSAVVKQDIAVVIAHELAHMWFGNLVTMEWWTDLFLKEGFARWMEHFCVDHVFPQYDIWSQFVSLHMSSAMKLDSLKHSHPIEVPIQDPVEVDSIYDLVSYSKSASIIRMLRAFIGDEAFKNGLREYLKKYSYNNAEAQNLWECLGRSSGKDVATLCSAWTKRMGYPMIEVELEETGDKRCLKFEQRRFLDAGSDGPYYIVSSRVDIIFFGQTKVIQYGKYQFLYVAPAWQSPLTTCLPKSKDDWSLTSDVAKTVGSRLAFVNTNCTGYYRVKYSAHLLEMLLAPIKSKILSAVDRFNVCSDTFAFVRAGLVPSTVYLTFLRGYEDETDFNVWAEVDSSIQTLRNCLERVNLENSFSAFVRHFYRKIYDRLGFNPLPSECTTFFRLSTCLLPISSAHTDTLLRPIILRRLGESGDESVIAKAEALYEKFLRGETIPSDIRATVRLGCHALMFNFNMQILALMSRHKGEAVFDQLLHTYKTTKSNEIKLDCMLAFGQSSSAVVLQKTMKLMLTDEIRLQDILYIFAGLVRTSLGQDAAWNFFKSNVGMIVEKCGSPTSTLFAYVVKVASVGVFSYKFFLAFQLVVRHQCSDAKADEIESFFKTENLMNTALSRPLYQSLENVRLNAALLNRDAVNIKQWLNNATFTKA